MSDLDDRQHLDRVSLRHDLDPVVAAPLRGPGPLVDPHTVDGLAPRLPSPAFVALVSSRPTLPAVEVPGASVRRSRSHVRRSRRIRRVLGVLVAVLVLAALAGLAVAAVAGASTQPDPPAPPDVCHEDEPCWNCTTMGNLRCSPLPPVTLPVSL